MSVILVTDSTCDLSPEILDQMGVSFVPLKVLFGEKEYVDKMDLSNSEFYEKMRISEQLPSTSQVNPNEFCDLFTEKLKEGHHIIGLFLSSELSGTYQSAVMAKEMLETDQVTLIDSRTTSFALGILVHYAKDLIDQGHKPDEIKLKVEEKAKKLQLYGMLDTLENLKKGGRLSSGKAIIGKMLNLKPIIQVEDGRVGMANKTRGSKKGMQWMIDQILEEYPDGELEEIGLAHSNSLEKLEHFKSVLFQSIKAKKVYEIEIGSVVGTHTGEQAVGIVFERKSLA